MPLARTLPASMEPRRLVSVPSSLTELARVQHGVVTRDQLRRLGFGQGQCRAAVAAKRWQAMGRNAVILHNTELTETQRRWAAVLIQCKPAALAGLTAAETYGLTGFRDDLVHVVVAHDGQSKQPRWIKVHHSRRFSPADVRTQSGLPRTAAARSLIDAATWSRYPRRACAILCAGVQQRLATADQLLTALGHAGSVRHVAIMRDILGDISGGGHTLVEIALTPLAARAGLSAPRRQVLRREPNGRARYVDAEFALPDGAVLMVEIDGAGHLQPTTQWDDQGRQNELTISGGLVLRFPSLAVRLKPGLVVDQLTRIRRAHL
jgi:hypothetical protein